MKIEAGKYYRTRDGRKVGPMEKGVSEGVKWVTGADGSVRGWLTDNGRAFGSHGSESDAVYEYPELTPHQQRTAEMIKVMQAYVDGEKVEYKRSCRDEWKSVKDCYVQGVPNWNWPQVDYRIAPAATPDELDWNLVGALWNYRARDKNGYVYLYEYEPVQSGDHWKVGEGEFARVDAIFTSYHRGTCDWKDSLMKRP